MRFYLDNYTKVDDIVFVKFKKKTEQYSILVDLVEYNMEGMIINSEISNRKANIDKIFGNKILPCLVLSVNEEKNYIDLSYKRVLEVDRQRYIQMYPIIEKIMSLPNELCELYDKLYPLEHTENQKPLKNKEIIKERLYNETIWRILNKNIFDLNSLNQLYEKLITQPELLFEHAKELPKEFISKSINLYKNRLKFTDMVVSNDLTLQILESDGISVLKDTLYNCIPEDLATKVKIECIASPKYRLTLTAQDDNEIKMFLSRIDLVIKNKLKDRSCIYKLDNDYVTIKKKSFTLAPYKSYINSI